MKALQTLVPTAGLESGAEYAESLVLLRILCGFSKQN